jgi:hypothetical protein
MRARPPAPRRLAALLAAVALMSAMARPVLACDMGHQGHAASVSAASADPHAHHGTLSDAPPPSEPVATPAPSAPSPAGVACDHVVGCAVMVFPSTQTIVITPVTVVGAAPRTADADVSAPTLAVEPPPPRR